MPSYLEEVVARHAERELLNSEASMKRTIDEVIALCELLEGDLGLKCGTYVDGVMEGWRWVRFYDSPIYVFDRDLASVYVRTWEAVLNDAGEVERVPHDWEQPAMQGLQMLLGLVTSMEGYAVSTEAGRLEEAARRTWTEAAKENVKRMLRERGIHR